MVLKNTTIVFKQEKLKTQQVNKTQADVNIAKKLPLLKIEIIRT
jgi:hypothetical protein